MTCIHAPSFDGLPEATRRRLREFLDAADSASPYQDPKFFSGRYFGEVDLLVEKEGRPVFFALGFENVAMTRYLPWLRSLVVHKGPVVDDPDALLAGLQALKEFGRERGVCEIVINPQVGGENTGWVGTICDTLGFRPASTAPHMTLRVDLGCDADQLLARFRKGTRYEVKRAQRIGIRVTQACTEADFSSFYRIYSQRAHRKGFSALSRVDFEELSKRICADPKRGALFLSEYKSKILAGAVALRAGPRVHYVYGATDAESAGNLPGLYPVLHRAFEWAVEIGCKEFDLGGFGLFTAPEVRRFKLGFGGEVYPFGPEYSLPLLPMLPQLRRIAKLLRA